MTYDVKDWLTTLENFKHERDRPDSSNLDGRQFGGGTEMGQDVLNGENPGDEAFRVKVRISGFRLDRTRGIASAREKGGDTSR